MYRINLPDGEIIAFFLLKGKIFPDKVLSAIIIIALLGAVAMLGYVIATPYRTGERFTEFYLLGSEGMANNYARELSLGEEGSALVGIINRERVVKEYRVDVVIDKEKIGGVGPIVLEQEEKWEGETIFLPTESGYNQKVEFLLYEMGKEAVKEELYLWINVRETD